MARCLLLSFLLVGCSVSQTDRAPTMIDRFDVAADLVDGVTSRVVLDRGVEYTVEVEGTVSLYQESQWRSVCAGTPEPQPMIGGGSDTGPVGDDPAYEFAVPSGSSVCSRDVPVPRSGWEYRTQANGAWTLSTTDAPLAPDHSYTYSIVGEGAPLGARIREGAEFADNYGSFRVTIYQ